MERRIKNRTESSDSDASGSSDNHQRSLYIQKVRESSDAIQRRDFPLAIRLYTEALTLDPKNYILYSNRSATFIKLAQYDKALKDAKKAKELNPKWPKAYYREGVALQCLGRMGESLAAYASGLVQDPNNPQLLKTLVQACLQPPLKEKFGPLFAQLQKMKLDKSPFVTVSVIGQELLASGFYSPSITVLESALRIGSCSVKLRGSVFSALSTAHWGLGNIDKAIACMQQDLAVVKSLGDQGGECRVHGNLGAAYFSKGNYREALQHHRFQLVLATRLKDTKTAAAALSSLGHVYTAVSDYPNALNSHKQCAFLAKQSKDKLQEAREIGNMGAVFLAMGDHKKAVDCHKEHLRISKQLSNKSEEARAYSNLGSAHHYKGDFNEAITYHNQVLNIAMELEDLMLEARAYAGLGHATRGKQDYVQAKFYHEKQLDNALQTKDKVAEGRSCSNLGIIYHQLGEFDAALKLHKAHLQIAKDLGDRASQGRSYGNIGNAHSALGQYDLAVRFHKQELAISKEVTDRHSEASTHGNLAVAYQSLEMYDKAIHHYNTHLNLAKELKDTRSEARALSNLGNYYCSRKLYSEAIPLYNQYLAISQELHDVEGEGRACHKLGYVHYSLGSHKEAIRYYEQDLALAKDLQDKASMCRAYCNLGLAHKALEDYPKALEYQKYFHATTLMTKDGQAKFLALGNIGDIHTKMGDTAEAVKVFSQQLTLSRQMKNRKLEAVAFGNLGSIHKSMKQFDKSLGYHNQELMTYQEINDLRGECKAHGNLGNVHMSLKKYRNACHCYEEQLDRSRELRDCVLEAHAYGNLGITKMNMGSFNDAIGYFESQLAMLEQASGHQVLSGRGQAHSNLGNCYESITDYEEAVKNYEQYLILSQSTGSTADQDAAYRGLGNANRAMGNLQQALVCFEKRLVVAHEVDNPEAKSSAYGELGCLHSLLGNFEQAISCLQHQLRIAEEMGDRLGQGEATCGLGGVYQQMGEYDRALEHHEKDLGIAEELDNAACKCRALGNLGLCNESLGNFDQALIHQEKHLAIAVEINDKTAKTLAYSSLGRIHHAQAHYQQAVQYLQQGLTIADQIQRPEDEAKIRHRLGLSLWGQGDLHGAQVQLYAAVDLFERIRRDAQFNSEYKLSLFDLQTASYQALQRVLVALNHQEDALVVAERGRTRAFVDLLLERQTVGADSWYSSLDSSPVTKEQITDTVTKQRVAVLYFSMAAGCLYSWLILPEKGIVRFHESPVSESDIGSDPEDSQSLKSFRSFSVSSMSLLDSYVGQAREMLGVESHLSSSRLSLNRLSGHMSETESEADDLWQQHLEEIGEKLNSQNDHTCFLRMERRDHIWNASSYSLGSMLNYSNGLLSNRSGSIRSKASTISSASMSGKPALGALYDLLIKPMEDVLPPNTGHQGCRDLILVLQGDLYLVPFALLKPSQTASALCERYNLLAVPSIRALQASQALSKHIRYTPDCTGAVVVGNPKLHQSVVNMWQWTPVPATEHECRMVSEMMGCRSLTGTNATKDNVLKEIPNAELLHFATHISWKLAAIVLSPGNFSTTSSVHGNLERMDLSDTSSEINLTFDGPPLCEFLVTAADILNMRLSARLVVLSSGYSDDRAGRINTDGVVGLTRAFLAAGAQCILFSLWPVPDMASRMLMKSFYTSMLQGAQASLALSGAMKSLQNSRQFSHPSNWAGWMLVGSDVKLGSKVALMGHALCELLKTPDLSREAMRVILHLVEKSLQRIHHGQRKAMYTTQHSIENKVGDVRGWRDLLTSVGFRLEPSTNDLPAAVFFPTFDPGERLTQCSASLQALLGLSVPTLSALAEMIEHPDVGEMVMILIREASSKFGQDASIQVPVSVRLWRAPGVHEFLASLGFDLVEVGKDEITLRVGKNANRRMLQFGLQSLIAVFDTQEAPRALLLDSSSSMESLCSSGSTTSTSNFSKGSTPPTSPSLCKRKSFFNPAEVDKLPSARQVRQSPNTHKLQGRVGSKSDISIHLTHQNVIREKYSSPSGSDLSDANVVEHYPRVISVDTGDGSCPEDAGDHRPLSRRSDRSHRSASATRSRNKFDRVSSRSGVVYSTSASDSEDGFVPENNLSRGKSRSSQSLASQASTLTIKSTGSGTGFRRNRSRASVASTRSSASDRTLTCDSRNGSQETLVDVDGKFEVNTPQQRGGLRDQSMDNLSDSGIHSKHDTATDNSADNDGHEARSRSRLQSKKRERSLTREEYKLDLSNDNFRRTHSTSKNSSNGNVNQEKKSSPLKDPTTVARKVLAETGQQRAALEEMQRWSVQSLKMKWENQSEPVTSTSNEEKQTDSNGTAEQLKPSDVQERKESSKPPLPSDKPKISAINQNSDTSSMNDANKENKETNDLLLQKHNFVTPNTAPKPRPILANSLGDGNSSYTCQPGERVNFLEEPVEVFSQSELESEPELSVIEEESEGVSDANTSFGPEGELSMRIASLQFDKKPKSILPVKTAPSQPAEKDIPWYEDPPIDSNEKKSCDNNTTKPIKTVTFHDEVEMEIMSQVSDSMDDSMVEMSVDVDNNCTNHIQETNLDSDIDVDTKPSKVSPVPVDQVTLSGRTFKQPRSLGLNKPSLPPPPIGYKPPPPYPGPRRTAEVTPVNLDHQGSFSQKTPLRGQPGHGTGPVVSGPVNDGGPKNAYNALFPDRSSSLSPMDGDMNTPQNLQKMAKQFYQGGGGGGPGGSGKVNGSFRATQRESEPSTSNQAQQHRLSYSQEHQTHQQHPSSQNLTHQSQHQQPPVSQHPQHQSHYPHPAQSHQQQHIPSNKPQNTQPQRSYQGHNSHQQHHPHPQSHPPPQQVHQLQQEHFSHQQRLHHHQHQQHQQHQQQHPNHPLSSHPNSHAPQHGTNPTHNPHNIPTNSHQHNISHQRRPQYPQNALEIRSGQGQGQIQSQRSSMQSQPVRNVAQMPQDTNHSYPAQFQTGHSQDMANRQVQGHSQNRGEGHSFRGESGYNDSSKHINNNIRPTLSNVHQSQATSQRLHPQRSSHTRHSSPSNGFSSPSSLSSHGSYAEMRSIFPQGRSPQNVAMGQSEGTVMFGSEVYHASKC